MKTLRSRSLTLALSALLTLPLHAQTIRTTTLDVGSGGDEGTYSSLAVVNGNPAISYYDRNHYDLRYVRALDPDGTSWGTPMTVDSTGTVGAYTSLAVVNGNPAISYWADGNLKYVRATDAGGTSWGTPVTLDSTGNVGAYTSLAVINGNPAISYYDETNGDLRFVRANDAGGASWGTPVTLDSTGTVGTYTSLAVVDGNPAISYHDSDNGNLKYVRANDANGASWGTPVTLDSTGVVGTYTSLAVVAGNPAISYYDSLNDNLRYVRATNANGTSWGAPKTLDSTGNVGAYTSLAVVNGNPAISYYDALNDNLKYVRATNASGSTSWGTPMTLDSTGNVGAYTSLAVVNGNPAISYYDETINGNLKYVRANDAGGASWGTPVTLDSTYYVGTYTSLAVVDGNPAISYYDQTNGNLKYVRANDANGASWGTPVILDSTGTVGEYTSLAVVNGNPAISYWADGNLKYVRATNASGTSWGTPMNLDSTGYVGAYTSLTVVAGNPAISYYDETNGNLKYVRALDPDGTNWGTPVTPDSTGNVGLYTSLAVVAGNPAISYYDKTNGDLKFVRATDANGASWGTPVTLDSTGNVGLYTSLAVVDGNPAISYYDFYDSTNDNLKFVRATYASGTLATDWGTPVTIDNTGWVGAYTSLAVVNGNPAISYYDQTNGDLKWATIVFPDIAVTQAGALTDGVGSVPFATLAVGSSSPALTFTIANTGPGDLTGLAVTRNGANAADFTVSALSATSIPAGAGTVTFTVTFTPGGAVTGPRNASIHIASNDPDLENPFDIALTGQALSFFTDTDADGLNDASEFQMAALGFDWQVGGAAQQALVSTYYAGANGAGLYTTTQVQALNVGAPLLTRDAVTGKFKLTIGVKKSTNLATVPFTAFPMNGAGMTTVINAAGKIEFEFPMTGNAAFFRLESQ